MAQPGDCAHNKLNTTQATQLNMTANFIGPRQNANTPCPLLLLCNKGNHTTRHGHTDKTIKLLDIAID
jgi:hypothetical protein